LIQVKTFSKKIPKKFLEAEFVAFRDFSLENKFAFWYCNISRVFNKITNKLKY